MTMSVLAEPEHDDLDPDLAQYIDDKYDWSKDGDDRVHASKHGGVIVQGDGSSGISDVVLPHPPSMMLAPSVSLHHFTPTQRTEIRHRINHSFHFLLAHSSQMQYTQSAARWEGIAQHDRVFKGQFPHHSDCSSSATWIIWDATLRWIRENHLGDFVNGQSWRAGYTGTMTHHGAYLSRGPSLIGDLVFYGGSFWVPEHVAIYAGGGRVWSHGSPGCRLLAVHYRPDYNHARRVILPLPV